jgi:ribulose-5-phosphate 4-epimerase/fuculose-1-phosphate aldolase
MEMTIKPAARKAPARQGRMEDYSPEEWQARVNLAATYRIADHYGMTDLVFTHITAKVPGPEEHFLINPYKMLFSEVTASNLVKIDLDGNIVEPTPYEVNTTGFVIHSAIHRGRPDLHCVWHSHTKAGIAVSMQKGGLLPASQYAMPFFNRVGYHDYEGLALDLDEQQRLQANLGKHYALILRNHGLITCGRTVPEAVAMMILLDKACQVQIAAQSGGSELVLPPAEVCEHTAQQFARMRGHEEDLEWPPLLRLVADQEADYAR